MSMPPRSLILEVNGQIAGSRVRKVEFLRFQSPKTKVSVRDGVVLLVAKARGIDDDVEKDRLFNYHTNIILT